MVLPPALRRGRARPTTGAVAAALWELVWAGRVSNDTLTPLRALTRGGRATHRTKAAPARPRMASTTGGRMRVTGRTGPPETAGRWALLPTLDTDPTRRAHATAERLLDRHGVVIRGAVVSERTPGGFAAAYKVLSAFEETGRCRRGYFVDGLGAAQFGTAGAIDRLRTFSETDPGDKPAALCLAATDPANPYGGRAPLAPRTSDAGGHRPGRKAGALVVLVDGELDGLRRARRQDAADVVRRPGPARSGGGGARRRGAPGVARPDDRRERRRDPAARAPAPRRSARRSRAPASSSPPRGLRTRVPEGDTVFRAARLLDRALTGRVLTASDFRVPQHATADLSGGTVVGTVSRGKHLLTRVDRGPEAWTLHTHLKMEGAWRVLDAGQRWPRPAHQARVVLTTADKVAVGFSLGVVELLERDAEETAVGHLGPDLLGPDWDADEAVRRLLAEPDRPVRDALLDQRNLAGIGNMYAAELCFVGGVHPQTPVGQVDRPAPAGAARAPDARPQQGAGVPVHDREPARARAAVGLPPGPVAVPALRHPDRGVEMRRRGARTRSAPLLVPVAASPNR